MTHFVIGNNSCQFVVGVSELNGIPTPFIAAVDMFKLGHDGEAIIGKEGCNAMIEKIAAAGGAILHIHNPVAARNLHDAMATIFDHAVQGSWGEMNQPKEIRQ